MGFVPITIDKFIALHLASNPSEKEADLRNSLNSALNDFKKESNVPVVMTSGLLDWHLPETDVSPALQARVIQQKITKLILQ